MVEEPECEGIIGVFEIVNVLGLVKSLFLRSIVFGGRIVVLLADDVLWVLETDSNDVVVVSTLVERSLIEHKVVVLHELCAHSPCISCLSTIFGRINLFIENSKEAHTFVETKLLGLDQKVFTRKIDDVILLIESINLKLNIESSLLLWRQL